MYEKREEPQGYSLSQSYSLMGEEIITVDDSDRFISNELLPFAVNALGAQDIKSGHMRYTKVDSRTDGESSSYEIAELSIIQTAKKGTKGLFYNLELTEVERVKRKELKLSWANIQKVINTYNTEKYNTNYFDVGAKPGHFDEISLFERTSFCFRRGRKPTREYYTGYIVVFLGIGTYFDIQTNLAPDPQTYRAETINDAETLRMLEEQSCSQLTTDDASRIYRTLKMLGHYPAGKNKIAAIKKQKDGHGKV